MISFKYGTIFFISGQHACNKSSKNKTVIFHASFQLQRLMTVEVRNKVERDRGWKSDIFQVQQLRICYELEQLKDKR